MKKAGAVLVILAAVLLPLAACDSASPGPGQEAVLVKKPVLFGKGGVHPQPVKTGRTFIAPTTDVVYVGVVTSQIAESFKDLMSSDELPLDFDTAIRVRITDSVALVRDFGGEHWYVNNVKAEYQNIVRQEVRGRSMNDMTINAAAIESADKAVFDKLSAHFRAEKLPVQLVGVTLGRANPPDEIKVQRIATATQKARQETEKQRTLAENERRAAEQARANADNAYRTSMQLSPDQFLQLEAIKMQRDVCANPKNPCTFLIGTGVTPTLGVR